MQALEYYFNPYLKRDNYLRVFEFKPKNKEFANLGYLYLIVEATNVLKEDKKLIEDLANLFSESFYSNPKILAERALVESLKKANQFLLKETQKGNTHWIGNLNIAVLNFSNYLLHFSRGGNVQILLLRGDELSDIAQDLEEKVIQNATNFFGGIATGKLIEGDILMVITQKLFEKLYDQVLPQLINLEKINDKNLKRFFKSKKKEMKDWSGLLFFLLIDQKTPGIFSFFTKIKINRTILLILSLSLLLLISYFLFR